MRVVICGAGQVGYGIAERLAAENNDVSVIDSSPELVQTCAAMSATARTPTCWLAPARSRPT